MGRYEVVVGDDFEIVAMEIEDVEDVAELSRIAERRANQRVQERLTYLIFGTIVSALLIATAIGIYDGGFNEVGSVWSAAALPLGYVLKAYFDKPATTVGSNGLRRKVK
jgi:hypothetical protein